MKILTRKFLLESSRLLRDALQEITSDRIVITVDASKIKKTDKFIRYGNSDPVIGKDSEFNSSNFIKLVGSKLRFSEAMAAENVHSPVYHPGTMPKPEDYPVVVRTKLCSFGGKGIVVCKNKEEFAPYYRVNYWTKFVKTTKEYRVHVLGGNIAKVFIKEREEGQEPEDLPIRNNDRGYHFRLVSIDYLPGIVKLVNQIHPILKGNMYTLDIGWDNVNKKYFVFEVNSGSGLNQNTSKLYAEFLASKLT